MPMRSGIEKRSTVPEHYEQGIQKLSLARQV